MNKDVILVDEENLRLIKMSRPEFKKYLMRLFLELKEEYRIRRLRRLNNFRMPRKIGNA